MSETLMLPWCVTGELHPSNAWNQYPGHSTIFPSHAMKSPFYLLPFDFALQWPVCQILAWRWWATSSEYAIVWSFCKPELYLEGSCSALALPVLSFVCHPGKLVVHLRDNASVQNIDLMNLSGRDVKCPDAFKDCLICMCHDALD